MYVLLIVDTTDRDSSTQDVYEVTMTTELRLLFITNTDHVSLRGEISGSLDLSSPHSFSLATKRILGPAERLQEDALLVPKSV